MAVTKTEITTSVKTIKVKAELIMQDLMEIKKTIEAQADAIFKNYDGNTFNELHTILRRIEYIDGHTKAIVQTAPNIVKRIEEL